MSRCSCDSNSARARSRRIAHLCRCVFVGRWASNSNFNTHFGVEANRGMSKLFRIVCGQLDFYHIGSFRISGLNDGFLNRGFGGRLHVRHGLVQFFCKFGFEGFFDFLPQGVAQPGRAPALGAGLLCHILKRIL